MFLEVLTRCYRRPGLLAVNQAGLAAQTSDDWAQTLLIDDVGRGIGWSTENMAAYAPQLVGDYVWILDDDDVCIRDTFVAELAGVVHAHHPDLIFVRMDHGPRGVLPDDAHWGREPARAVIGVSAFVVARSLWQSCAWALCPGYYESDYEFAAVLFRHATRVYWHDVIASRVQQIGLGRPECAS